MLDVDVIAAKKGRISKGFYVARMRKWPEHHSWVVVQVVPIMLADDPEFVVQEAGKPGFSEVREWRFRNRILGLSEIKRPANPFLGGPFRFRERTVSPVMNHCAI